MHICSRETEGTSIKHQLRTGALHEAIHVLRTCWRRREGGSASYTKEDIDQYHHQTHNRTSLYMAISARIHNNHTPNKYASAYTLTYTKLLYHALRHAKTNKYCN